MFELHAQLVKDCIVLGELPLSTVLLCNDSHYPWLILVPRRKGVKEIFELDEQDQLQLLKESSAVSAKLYEYFSAHKLNVAALGNQVEQLHVHHVVRYQDDIAWPKPIWGVAPANPYDDEVLQNEVVALQNLLATLGLKPI